MLTSTSQVAAFNRASKQSHKLCMQMVVRKKLQRALEGYTQKQVARIIVAALVTYNKKPFCS